MSEYDALTCARRVCSWEFVQSLIGFQLFEDATMESLFGIRAVV